MFWINNLFINGPSLTCDLVCRLSVLPIVHCCGSPVSNYFHFTHHLDTCRVSPHHPPTILFQTVLTILAHSLESSSITIPVWIWSRIILNPDIICGEKEHFCNTESSHPGTWFFSFFPIYTGLPSYPSVSVTAFFRQVPHIYFKVGYIHTHGIMP